MRAMPGSSPKPSIMCSQPLRQGGFSLLELMIVMVIIGILVSIFTLSVGSFDDNEAEEHARRLEALLDLAMEDATMQGREIGLRIYQHGYEFSARAPQVDEQGLQYWAWVRLDDDRFLQPRELGDDYALELIVEGKELDLDFDRKEDEDEYLPQIYIFSSGDVAPEFELRIRQSYASGAIVLTASVDGSVEVKADEF